MQLTSEDELRGCLKRLENTLVEIGQSVVAVSGGIDSTLLAVIAGRLDGVEIEVFHAVSPAVPKRATQRVLEYAELENWNLTVADVGEFQDEQYMLNPINRCFYCKTNLYSYMANRTDGQLLSGTNLDDLNDFRPGLKAAERHSVRHPYVETNITKSDIRSIATRLNMNSLAQLPASPCLSSRMQTGTPIDAGCLQAIDEVENAIQRELSASITRCRVNGNGVVIELDPDSLTRLDAEDRKLVSELVHEHFPDGFGQPVPTFAPYRMGSAFVAMEER